MFKITGLSPRPFAHLFGRSDAELATMGAVGYIVDATPGFPDRIELREGEIGERMILVNYEHQPADSPYRSSHAVFVRDGATETRTFVDEVPESLATRVLSLRGFDENHMIVAAELTDGRDFEGAIARLFARRDVAYVHAHLATRGCYAARVDRA